MTTPAPDKPPRAPLPGELDLTESTEPALAPPVALNDELGKHLGAAKPASGIGHAVMRANLREKLFGEPPAPVRLHRYVLIDRLGEGGMGVVYSAYDPELDRKVALKLLRPGSGQTSERARDRLLREAQALAKLSHPNVVPVYDVGLLDGQVFIVMEFVIGQTLRDWAKVESRPWRDVLAAYRQAGLGLAAAHAVDLVHRDFKPDNVLVGKDNRIRVLDFGLARGRLPGAPDESDETGPIPLDPHADIFSFASTQDMAPAEQPPAAEQSTPGAPRSNNRLHIPLTMTGAVLGTPAYMAPEQFAGVRVGPASDQFSFCVSLYEGLYGQRPFAGDTLAELHVSVSQGELRPPPRNSGVPGWIFPILSRGLQTRPADRYPSMEVLLRELERDPARARRRWLVAGLVAGLAGISAFSLTQLHSTAPDPCTGAERELAGVWSQQRQRALEAVFARTQRPYARLAWQQVATGLERYTDAWVTMHEDACRAHQRGQQSGALLDKRMACLERRKVALGSALSVLSETNAESLQNAVEVTQKLPAIDYCANTEALAAEVPPPEDPQIAERVRVLRERMSRAKALEDAGRYTEALALAKELATQAAPLEYRPLLAELRLLEGRILIATRDLGRAIAPLHQAMTLGLAMDMNAVGLEALARRLFAEGTEVGHSSGVLSWVDIAEALIEQVPEPTFVHALLLNNAGAVHMALGERDQARQLFERALAVKSRASSPVPVELAVVQYNLALVTPEPAQRAALMDSASQELETALGAAHPKTLEWRVAQAMYVTDPQIAYRILDATCRLYQQYHPALREPQAHCFYQLGVLDAELGNRQRAASHLMQAAALFPDAHVLMLHELARGQGLLLQGNPDLALPILDRVIEALASKAAHWWVDKRLAEARLAKGMSLMALGNAEAAAKTLEQARAGFERVIGRNYNVDTQQRLARTQVALASALWNTPASQPASKAREQAAELAASALAWYRSAGPGYEMHITELEEWYRARGLSPAAR